MLSRAAASGIRGRVRNTASRSYSSRAHDLQVGDQLRNWRVVARKDVEEFSLRATELRHEFSAAKFLRLTPVTAGDKDKGGGADEINSFSVNFKTTPADSTGKL